MINEESKKKAAFVAVVGRPSAGKSTLVNLVCGQKVSIVSKAPQTTRNAIRGIVNRNAGQLVFVDTPGRHESERKLNKKLLDVSNRSIADAEIVLYVLDASRKPASEEEAIAEKLKPLAGQCLAVINKTDLPGADPAPAKDFLHERLPNLPERRIFTISALHDSNAEAIINALFEMAGEGEAFYPEDYYTDQDIAFRISEIIREQAIKRLRQELPYALYVETADTELRDEGKRLWVRAFIVMERESQKGMVVGKDGTVIKAIRQGAQKELNRIFDWKVELDLRVKTAHDWRHNDKTLRRLIDRG
ncbi:MAG: GTPase Era [Treponema sp.]|jgi:GTP-binding protein Era|nr:GTPase Era [Treponema sp.]